MKKVLVILLLAIVAVTGAMSFNAEAADKITVGAKHFTEQYIVGEMMALMLEENGFDVTTRMGTGSSVTRQALVTGQTDIYAEYTGTAWLVYLEKSEVITDPDELYNKVKELDLEKNDIVWLERANVNNTFALAIKQDDTDKYGNSISELTEYINAHPGEIRIGLDQEFYARSDGLPAMAELYGMNVEKRDLKIMDIGLTYEALDRDQLDVAMAYATDGKIPKYDLIILEDDKHFFPVYNLCPTVNKKVLDEYPEIREIMSSMTSVLDNKIMQQLNYEVDVNGKPARMVAEIFLKEKGLID